MPLLNIATSKKITATVTIESATAALVDRYAAFTKASADDVIETALSFVFAKDKDFQAFLDPSAKSTAKPLSALRIKRSAAPTKSGIAIEPAAD